MESRGPKTFGGGSGGVPRALSPVPHEWGITGVDRP
jgi:hypothetical protein